MFLTFKKFRIILVLLFVLIIILVIKIYVGLQPQPVPEPAVSLPEIPVLQEAPTTLQYSLETNWPQYPEKLPVYKITEVQPISFVAAKKIAAGLGFISEPTTSTDIETGIFYNWNENGKYLSIGGKPAVISYGLSDFENISTSSAALSFQEADSLAQKFLEEKGLNNPSFDLKNPLFSTDSGTITVSYNYLLSGIPVLNNNPTTMAVSISFDSYGNITRLEITQYPEFEKSQEVKIISQKQAMENLTAQKGTIVYVADKNNKKIDVPVNYQIGYSKINKVSLIYYYPSSMITNVVLTPVFVFEGEGVDTSGKTIEIITYLPATALP